MEGSDASLRERLKEELGVDDDQITRFEMAMAMPVQIDAGAGGDDSEDGVRTHALRSEEEPPDSQALGRIAQEQAGKLVSEALSALSAREVRIVRARHLDEPAMTLEALAAELGISRERVRQIEIRTLGKIRDVMLARGVTSVGDLFE